MKTICENSLIQNFVMPVLCHELVACGLDAKTIYQWKVRRHVTTLVTNAFDQDNYYVAGNEHIDSIDPPSHIIPAYSTKDIEKCLPDYLLATGPEGYRLVLDKFYEIPEAISPRMPDAFAMLLITMIKKSMVDLSKIKMLISAYNLQHNF